MVFVLIAGLRFDNDNWDNNSQVHVVFASYAIAWAAR